MRVICAVVMALLSGCGVARFEVEQALDEQTVPGNVLAGVLPTLLAKPFQFSIDVKAEAQKRNTGPVTSAVLKSLVFTITPPQKPSGTFDFLESVHLSVEGPAGSGLPKLEVARIDPVPRGATTLEFVMVPNVDLLPYVNAGATISATAKGTQPSRDVTFSGKAVVELRI